MPAERKISRNPRANSIGVVSGPCRPTSCAIHAKYRTALGMAITRLAAEKKPIAVRRQAGGEHVVHPHAEADEGDGDQRGDDQT